MKGQKTKNLRERLLFYSPYVVIAIWVEIALYISSENPTVGLSDAFGFFSRAESLSLHSISPWVNGFYPFGYPVSLMSLSMLVGDYVLAGRIISLLCGVLGLITICRLSRDLFSPSVALITVIVCCTNHAYLKYATISNTDMPAAVLLILGIYFICRYTIKNQRRFLLAAGATVGLAYLFRYTALMVVPAVLLFFWLRPQQADTWKLRLQTSLYFILAFFVAASPQLVVSLIAKANPFYNLQAQNVYFGMFGQMDWQLNWPEASKINGLSEVIFSHPGIFLDHWYHNLLGSYRYLVDFPLEGLAFSGLLFSLKHRHAQDMVFLLALVLVSFTSAICLVFTNSRLLLFGNIILSIFVGYACITFLPKRLHLSFPHSLPFRAPFLVAMSIWLTVTYTYPAIHNALPEKDRSRILVSQVIESSGVGNPLRVLSLSTYFYDMRGKVKRRFATPWWHKTDFKPYQSIEDLALRMWEADQQFLVFDHQSPRYVSGLDQIFPFDASQLARFFDHVATFPGPVHIFRLKTECMERIAEGKIHPD